jgi:hypothetical protein
VLTAFATTPLEMQLLEVLVGFGIAGTGFGVILAVVGRASGAENRSLALGIATAAGSAGQVIGAPLCRDSCCGRCRGRGCSSSLP